MLALLLIIREIESTEINHINFFTKIESHSAKYRQFGIYSSSPAPFVRLRSWGGERELLVLMVFITDSL